MTFRLTLATGALAGVMASIIACNNQARAGNDRPAATGVDSLQACRLPIPVGDSVAGLPPAQACMFASLAWSRLAGGPAKPGMPVPGDTAAVASAVVREIAELSLHGDTLGAWWLVTFRLPSRAYDVEARVSKRDKSVQIGRVHKPMQAPGKG